MYDSLSLFNEKNIEQFFNHRLRQINKDNNAINKSQSREQKSREPTSVPTASSFKKPKT